jgi:uncharacterized SAM-binding protein YcdF (DUF218 family)
VKSLARRRPLQPESGGIISSLVSLIFIVVLCAVLYFARAPILRVLGETWIVEDPLEKSDAIIVLSDDNFYADRAAHAADLYRHGWAPVVVASGRKLRPYAGVGELMQHDLTERGVPKDKIVTISHNAENTREEAQILLQQATEHKWHSVIIVTSNYHTRRARYIFLRVFPQQFGVTVSGANDGSFEPEHWWQSRLGVKELTKEMVGMLVAMWELRGGSKSLPAPPAVVALYELRPL